MNSPRYVLDANVFIQANNEYYSLEFAPMFWDTLAEYARSGIIGSIDKVRDELEREGDPLWNWLQTEFDTAFYSTNDDEVLLSYREIIQWANEQEQFFDYAKADFAQVADAWLIAYARAKDCIIVTQEKFAPQMKRKIQIPNVCNAFDVGCMDTFQLLRELRVRWENS